MRNERETSEKPKIFKIEKIEKEAHEINTYWFNGKIDAKPGQFVMIWVPEIGQRPIGISYHEKDRFAITVRKVGKVTEKIFSMNAGDNLGIQGPYGNGFSENGKNVVLVGGGYGTSPIAFLAEELKKKGKQVFLLTGSVTEKYLLFRERFKDSAIKTVFSTDDGSFGEKGFCTDCLAELVKKEKIDYAYTCGPEIMMKRVMEICKENNIECELSLERYMKCGFGVCGSCCIDGSGLRVCKDGPVFTLSQVEKLSEFSRYKRDGSGKKVSF